MDVQEAQFTMHSLLIVETLLYLMGAQEAQLTMHLLLTVVTRIQSPWSTVFCMQEGLVVTSLNTWFLIWTYFYYYT